MISGNVGAGALSAQAIIQSAQTDLGSEDHRVEPIRVIGEFPAELAREVSEARAVDAGGRSTESAQGAAADIEHVGQQFESLFVSLMIQQMRNSLEQGLFGGEASDTYGGLFDQFMGEHLAASSPLGINLAVQESLQGYSNAEHIIEKYRQHLNEPHLPTTVGESG